MALFLFTTSSGTNFNDRFLKLFSNIGIYGLISSVLFWFWRVVIKGTSKPYSETSGYRSVLLFCIYFLIFGFLTILGNPLSPNQKKPMQPLGQIKTTPIENPTYTPLPTLFPTPTVEVCEITKPYKFEWKTNICDTFNENTSIINNFKSGVLLDDEFGKVEGKFSNGKYLINYLGSPYRGASLGIPIRSQNELLISSESLFFLSLDGFFDCDSNFCGWGISWGNTDSNHTFFISNKGEYSLVENEGSQRKELIPQKSSKKIKIDDFNNIVVLIEGENFKFIINDDLIIENKGKQFEYNTLYLYMFTGEDTSTYYEFDNLLIKSRYN